MMSGDLTTAAERLEKAAAEFGAAYQELRNAAQAGLRDLYKVQTSNQTAGIYASFDHLELEAAGALAAAGCEALFNSGIRAPDPVTDFTDRWTRREAQLLERLGKASPAGQS